MSWEEVEDIKKYKKKRYNHDYALSDNASYHNQKQDQGSWWFFDWDECYENMPSEDELLGK